MASLCGMTYLPPFALFGSRLAVEENRLDQHLDDWRKLLLALQQDRVDTEAARQLPKLNHDLDAIIRESA
jgi:hypothetical protein